MLLMIDNYDSFVYNLVQYFGELEQQVIVYRNDKITLKQIEEMSPNGIVLSPGPGKPEEAGICIEVIKKFAGKIPILGVCLGHQAIGHVFGGKVIRANKPMHGKSSKIIHDKKRLFFGIPVPFRGGRYHSLIISKESFPDSLEITAWTEEGEIMGVAHKDMHVYGVQFHPESVLTEHGHKLLSNFLEIIAKEKGEGV
ncbi:aminodeoxychorismate/anthranilate synthase component II [Peptococcaceae bacterium]|nr:aminodeoxychorismate/anthranilate synthase component II [Peptococcaceae bacterium]MCL0100455.1 aminodeoxychorismate/anthranilate synthase component II [Peptococcaceae bacterium]